MGFSSNRGYCVALYKMLTTKETVKALIDSYKTRMFSTETHFSVLYFSSFKKDTVDTKQGRFAGGN